MLLFPEYQAFVESRFRDLVGAIDPNLPVQWPNIAFKTPNDRHYLQWRIFDEEYFRASLGSNPVYRHVGGIQMDILSPLNVGTRPASILATGLLDGFRDKQFQIDHGHIVQYRRGSSQNLDDDNNRLRTMLRVVYHRDVYT